MLKLKSNKMRFITRLVLLCPLSLLMGFVGVMGTGGGHGNYFPLILISGPVSILFVIPLYGFVKGICFLCGMLCLYGTYALLLKFIKFDKTFCSILVFHIMSALITMFFLNTNKHYPMFISDGIDDSATQILLVLNTIIFTLWVFVLWLLILIHRSRGLWQ